MQEKRIITIEPRVHKLNTLDSTEIPKKRVCAYARVSTDQEDQVHSYHAQIKEFTERIQANQHWEFVGMYADEGITGTSMSKRPNFLKMINDAKNNKIDLILTKSLSRFSRNTVDSLTIIRELRDVNVEIFFEKENLYSSDPKVDFMLTIFSSMAQEEARNISDNVKWGIRKRFKDGNVKINTSRFLGYDKDENGQIIINESEAKTVKMIFNLFIAGLSYKQIADKLTKNEIKNGRGLVKWNHSSIMGILSNEKYSGDAILQKRVVLDYLTHRSVKNENHVPMYHIIDNHEPIISKEVFQIVQTLKNKRSITSTASTFKTTYPLSGLVHCGYCGRIMNRHYYSYGKPNQRIVLSCKNRYQEIIDCPGENIDNQTLENACVTAIKHINLFDDTIINKTVDIIASTFTSDKIMNEIAKLKDDITKAESAISKIIEAKINDADVSKSKYYNDLYEGKRKTISSNQSLIDDLEVKLLDHHENNLRKQEIKSFLENDQAISYNIIKSIFKRIIVITKDKVLFVMSNKEITRDEMTANISLFKELPIIYEGVHIDERTDRTITYKIVKHEENNHE